MNDTMDTILGKIASPDNAYGGGGVPHWRGHSAPRSPGWSAICRNAKRSRLCRRNMPPCWISSAHWKTV